MNSTGIRPLVVHCTALLLFLSTAQADVNPPAAVTAVSVHAYRLDVDKDGFEKAKQERIAKELETIGYAPVWTKTVYEEELGNWSYLLVGKHENRPDATITKSWLNRDGYSDAEEKSFQNTEGLEFETVTTNPRGRRLVGRGMNFLNEPSPDAAESAVIHDLEQQLDSAMNEADLLLQSPSHRAEVRARILRLYYQNEIIKLSRDRSIRFPISIQTDPVAYSEIEKNQITKLSKIANGDFPASKRDRAEAAFTVAQIYHEYLGDRWQVYELYNEMMDEYGKDEPIRLRAHVLRTGIIAELARQNEADHADVKRECEKILSRYPENYQNARAVADLILWQTHLSAGEIPQAKEMLSTFATRYPNNPREQFAANLHAAYAAGLLGSREDAVKYLKRNANLQVPADYRMTWAGRDIDLYSQSMVRLFGYLDEMGIELDDVDKEIRGNLFSEKPEGKHFAFYFLEEAVVLLSDESIDLR